MHRQRKPRPVAAARLDPAQAFGGPHRREEVAGLRPRILALETRAATRPALEETPENDGGTLTVEDVYHEYGERVYQVAWRMLGNDADAEDVTQEVLLQVVRRLSTFRGDSLLSTWLYRMTVNAVLALRRKRAIRRERRFSDPLPKSDGPARPLLRRVSAPEEQILTRELQQLIGDAVDRLPPLYRSTYILADLAGLSNGEVGKVLDLGLAAVKSRLHRARRLMRNLLARHFEREPG